jgi:hypothetical protein
MAGHKKGGDCWEADTNSLSELNARQGGCVEISQYDVRGTPPDFGQGGVGIYGGANDGNPRERSQQAKQTAQGIAVGSHNHDSNLIVWVSHNAPPLWDLAVSGSLLGLGTTVEARSIGQKQLIVSVRQVS